MTKSADSNKQASTSRGERERNEKRELALIFYT
jgi:hypothetical protein